MASKPRPSARRRRRARSGSANGRNPIAIIIPCHRVIGANGSLTGFGGGMERKQILLESGTRRRFAGPRQLIITKLQPSWGIALAGRGVLKSRRENAGGVPECGSCWLVSCALWLWPRRALRPRSNRKAGATPTSKASPPRRSATMRGRVTATLTCRPPTGDIVVTDYTLARDARGARTAAVRIGAMSVNVPMTLEGRGRNRAVVINLPQRPPILAAVQPNDRLSVTVNNETAHLPGRRPGADARSRLRLLGQLRFLCAARVACGKTWRVTSRIAHRGVAAHGRVESDQSQQTAAATGRGLRRRARGDTRRRRARSSRRC